MLQKLRICKMEMSIYDYSSNRNIMMNINHNNHLTPCLPIHPQFVIKDPNQIAECDILLTKYKYVRYHNFKLYYCMSKITYHHRLFLLYHRF
jgi:hypothetical protein